MKQPHLANRIIIGFAGLALAFSAPTARSAISFTSSGGDDYTADSGALSQVIPDNDPSGVAYDLKFGPTGLTMSGITITINITGGQNGDLYAYLSNPGGNIVTLLNRPGSSSATYGYADAGINIILIDSASGNIHNYGGNGGNQLTGSYKPNDGTTSFGSQFGGSNPSGDWTLFFADLSGGSVSTLQSFSVDVSAVPEPSQWGAIAGTGLLVICGARIWRRMRAA